MNLKKIRERGRKKIDDTAKANGGYLWSDDQLDEWINEAVDEICLRSRTLQDATSAFCTLKIRAGVNRYELDPSILVVRRAKLDSQPRDPTLCMTTMDILDTRFPTWDNPVVTGPPQWGFTNKDYGDHLTLFVAPYPSQDDTLRLTVWRLPTPDERLCDDDDVPPIPSRQHKDIDYWIEHKAFEIKDSEMYDPDRSTKALAMFDAIFGERPTEHELKLMGTNRLRGVKADFF